MTTMDRHSRDTIATYGPAPTTPAETLAHVLCVYAQQSDDYMLVQATSGIYGDGMRTGLTLGDLRAIQHQLDQAEQPTDADIVQLAQQIPAECPTCGAPADETGTRIPEHRPGSPCTVDYRPV